jgi:hypothetical protein
LKPEEYVKPDSDALDLIIQANNQPDLPHILILGEMNLGIVERYFADYSSVIESKEEIPLYAEDTKTADTVCCIKSRNAGAGIGFNKRSNMV